MIERMSQEIRGSATSDSFIEETNNLLQRASQVGFLSRKLKVDNFNLREGEMLDDRRSLSPMSRRKHWTTSRTPTKLLPTAKTEQTREVVVLFLNRVFAVLDLMAIVMMIMYCNRHTAFRQAIEESSVSKIT
eukprot:768079-Hanusia_phi.AAC.3